MQLHTDAGAAQQARVKTCMLDTSILAPLHCAVSEEELRHGTDGMCFLRAVHCPQHRTRAARRPRVPDQQQAGLWRGFRPSAPGQHGAGPGWPGLAWARLGWARLGWARLDGPASKGLWQAAAPDGARRASE